MADYQDQQNKYKAFLDKLPAMLEDEQTELHNHLDKIMGGEEHPRTEIISMISMFFPNFVNEYVEAGAPMAESMINAIGTSIKMGYLIHKAEMDGTL